MTQSAHIVNSPPEETVPLPELPEGFFRGVKRPEKSWAERQQQLGGMLWYDSIIDDILAHPGTDLKSTAQRLGRAPKTIYLICGSDLFKARYAQRRAKFNDDLDMRLTGKIAKVAELALDATITTLEKKQDAIPLQHLKEIGKDALDRLGYGPSRSESPSVVVHNTNNTVAVAQTQVSGESLARAREAMRQLNSMNADEARGAEVEGSAVRVEEKG